ncbi:MAG: hypothetical protein ACQEP1_02400 [Nanobdellota archaeon]
MPSGWEYKQRVRKFFTFGYRENLQIITSILIITFIWAFNYDSESFILSDWIWNFILTLIMVTISFYVHISAQKLAALYYGYRVRYKQSFTGMILSIIVAIISNGMFPVLIVGGITLSHLSRLRIGEFRYGLNTMESMKSALAGPFANVFLVMFIKTTQWIIGIESAWIDDMFVFNLVFAVYMMLPIKPLPGVYVFFGSRVWYVFAFSVMLTYILLIILFDYYSLIGGLVLGGLIYLIYFWNVEK